MAADGQPAGDVMDDSAVSFVVASGHSKAWVDAQRARLHSLWAAPEGASAVFQDGWRPLGRWSLRLAGLSSLGVGGLDLRHRGRASGARAPLVWAAGGVGGLLGIAMVALLLR